MKDKYVKFKNIDGIGVLTLNRAEKLNSFNTELLAELDTLVNHISDNKEVKVLIITGEGRAFCAGGDINWEKEIGELESEDTMRIMSDLQKLFLKIEQLRLPVIAAINGYAVGGGNELATACDIRIASTSAKFMHPETGLGVVAPLGGTQRLPRLIGLGRAKLMLYTGIQIDAKKAYDWGLVDEVVDDDRLMPYAMEMAQQIIQKPSKALELTKKAVNKNYHKDLVDKDELNYYVACSKTTENKQRLNKFLEGKKK